MSQNYRPTFVEIDLKKLVLNYKKKTEGLSPDVFVCPMVKANAYGHGDIQVAEELVAQGCKNLGVGLVEEALRLKQAGILAKIFVFGFYGAEASKIICDSGFIPVVSGWDQLKQLANFAKNQEIHLKVNTGMNRLGFPVSQAELLKNFLNKHSNIKLTGACTHLSSGDDAIVSESQLKKFSIFLDLLNEPNLQLHAYNSSGSHLKKLREKWNIGLRLGIALYGLQDPELSPVMSFKSTVTAIQSLSPGQSVSYGGEWTAEVESLIGIVPVGYADGLRRSYWREGQVLVNKTRVNFAGRICMDYCLLDLTPLGLPERELLNQEVILWGSQSGEIIKVSEFAKKLGTIEYEVVTSVGERVPRCFVGGSS